MTKQWWANVNVDEGMIQAVTCGPDGTTLLPMRGRMRSLTATFYLGNPVIAVTFFYNGSEEEGRKNFKAFFDIGELS